MELGSLDFLKQQDLPAGALYMVATPIGNLGDITLRALHVLSSVDGIACEDTRHSAALLQQFGIHKKCLALHAHNEHSASQTVLEHLAKGERWAYISDAGTPGVSDPGARLVDAAQKAALRVIPIPGPSAVSSAISVSGSVMLNSEGQFQFLGFWPHKTKERELILRDICESKKTSIFFESPHHIRETLLLLANSLEGDRQIFICRELTKKFEQLISIKANEISTWIEAHQTLKGEFIILIEGRPAAANEPVDHDALMRWANVLSPFLSSKEIATVLSQILGIAKKDAYQIALDVKAIGEEK
ncbi:MAG: 16S rRNA (cytidine(1402)-2'-O)-methyltransferase [Polynucleobacter sp.]|uniref:16S rRNA (cytidine(1402)-2'-O)-methyltransferase n=1 Tax=Polynucleobacter sp. TaxID=2029855 RepID=UPI0021745B03|nr:16S rRNA (cytidine(1402)-2'-O)-methyltransferase [Polynucleobacter sp.]MBU3670656.1 16S rRNA (cytidine(1402)-2'-O)-methyltransferase [Polynucleobacter sp.]